MSDLLICSNMKQLKNLKKMCGYSYTVGTSKYSFFSECKINGEPVIYLELAELSNSDRIWEIVDKVMQIIESCGIENSYLYRVSYHAEGGFATTIDVLLQNIKLFKRVTGEYGIESVYFADDKENWIINETFFICLHSMGMKCRIFDAECEKEQNVLFTLRRSKYNPVVVRSEFNPQEHDGTLRYYRGRESKSIGDGKAKETEVGFLYASREDGKQVQWSIDDVRLYKDRFSVGIISLYRNGDNETFRKNNIEVECLEDYFNRELFEENYRIYIKDSRRIADELQGLKVTFEGVDLSEYLIRKVISYIEKTCLTKLYIDTCSKAFFRYHNYKIIKSWGDTNFWENNVMYANSRNDNTKFFRRDVLRLYQTREYEPYANEIAVRLMEDKEVYRMSILRNFIGKIYYLPGYCMEDFINGISDIDISISGQIKVLFAPSRPLAGFSTVKGFFDTCTNILERLPSEQCKVYFKNHPGIDEAMRIEIEGKYELNENIECIDNRRGIWPELEKCDIVITSPSTVVFDAIQAGKPVFCIAISQNYELICHHEGGINIYRDVNKCCDELLEMFKDRDKLKATLESIANRQNDYLKGLAGKMPENGYKDLWDIIEKEMG